jgi:hypothetical protein
MITRQPWISAVAAIAAAVVAGSSQPRTARAADITFTGGGDGTSWTDPLNWMDDDTMANVVPAGSDQAFINGAFNVDIDSQVTVGSFAVGHGGGTATLNILPGADVTVNNTSRVGRGGAVAGDTLGRVLQTGGAVNFPNNSRLGLTFDSRTPPEVNADSLYEISGGSLTMAGLGSIQIGRTNNSAGLPITFNRAEFRVVGSGPALIEANRLSLDGGGQQGTPVVGFVIDSGGVTTIQLRDFLRLNQGATLEVNVNSATVPTTDITLIAADHFAGTLTEFVGMPDLSTISDIFNQRLYEWTLDYTNESDDGVIDSFVRLTDPRNFRGGDANKDGTVNLQDFNILASNFGTNGQTWTTGDFTGDTIVNLQDFNVLASNFGLTGSPEGPTPEDWATLGAAVPEPASIGLLAVCALSLVRRRRA